MKIDMHIHTTASDGTDAPEEIVDKVIDAGLDYFAITDHDEISSCEPARKHLAYLADAGRACLPRFTNGVEFSCKDEMGKYHILGYGFDDKNEDIKRRIDEGHALRMKKMQLRIDFIKDEYGFSLTDEELSFMIEKKSPGKPHLADAMIKAGYVDSRNEAITRYINNAPVLDVYLRPEDAIAAIKKGGGIAILAHPIFGNGEEYIRGDKLSERIRRLQKLGIAGIEAYYSKNDGKMTAELLSLVERYDMYATCGSDYHGAGRKVQLGKIIEGSRDQNDRLQALIKALFY